MSTSLKFFATPSAPRKKIKPNLKKIFITKATILQQFFSSALIFALVFRTCLIEANTCSSRHFSIRPTVFELLTKPQFYNNFLAPRGFWRSFFGLVSSRRTFVPADTCRSDQPFSSYQQNKILQQVFSSARIFALVFWISPIELKICSIGHFSI